MNNLKSVYAIVRVVFVVVCFQMLTLGQADDKNRIATLTAGGSSVRWDVSAPHSELTLTISAPDGQVFRKEFKGGAGAEFTITDQKGERLPDGQYTYELRLTPAFSADVKETLASARAKGNGEEVAREMRKRGVLPSQPLVQSGSFAILNGAVIVAGALEGGARDVGSVAPTLTSPTLPSPRVLSPGNRPVVTGFRRHHAPVNPFFDFVIADDLIVQGSACVGLDCVDGEVFGFDTIRVKENNTRIQYNDTSTSAGFATNNWQIRANSSASGGGSFLAFVDQGATGSSETGTIVFEVDAGAPANSLRVSSTGNIGVGTATPVLDFHANTTDTPAIRLEQNNSGGFTAQTWDIGANEANFFVRDVTSGSRLPFRIRPGAPTSSLDISAEGYVGVGIQSPESSIHANSAATPPDSQFRATANALGSFSILVFAPDNIQNGFDADWNGSAWIARNASSARFIKNANQLRFSGNTGLTVGNSFTPTDRMTLDLGNGRVGIGTTAPDQLLSVNGEASKAGGGTWLVFSDERLKKIKGPFTSGLKAVMQLQPLRYEYKKDNGLGLNSVGEHVGFSAQALEKVIPAAVLKTDSGYLQVNNDPIIWTMLNAIKEQQKQIEQLKSEVRKLRAARRRK